MTAPKIAHPEAANEHRVRIIPAGEVVSVGPWTSVERFDKEEREFSWEGSRGVQRLTWLVDGALECTDSHGDNEALEPGVAVLVTECPITYSEHGTASGLSLSAVVPANLDPDPGYDSFQPEPVRMADHEVAVIAGEINGADSALGVHSPLVAVEVRFTTSQPLLFDAEWEFGVLADDAVSVNGVPVAAGEFAVVDGAVTIAADANAGRVIRAFVIGGEPI